MKDAARSYAGLGDYLGSVFDITLSGGAEPEVLKGVSVSANFLNILQMEPVLGRGFRPGGRYRGRTAGGDDQRRIVAAAVLMETRGFFARPLPWTRFRTPSSVCCRPASSFPNPLWTYGSPGHRSS